jgi:GT2 family glycosyltransferase
LKVSIIIVTWNSAQFMQGCLTSIKKQSYKNWELIVVDNGSKDKTLDIVKEIYPGARIIKNNDNLGFCRANNQGIAIAQGDYILTLNSDVNLHTDYIKELILAAENQPEEIGMLGGKMIRMDKQTIDSAGLILSKSRRFYDRGGGEIDEGQYDDQSEVFGICAGAALYKSKMLEEIKVEGHFFDEDFFSFAEDFDVAWRAQLYGWRAAYIPQAQCLHLRGGSEPQSKYKQYLSFKNRYLLMLKNDSLINVFLAFPWLLIYDTARFFYLLFTNTLLFKAIWEITRLLPTMLRRRKIILSHQKVSNQYIRSWLR